MKFLIEKTWWGEPTLINLHKTISEIEKNSPDMIIAIEGDVIDGAKMVRTYYEFPFFDLNDTRFPIQRKTSFVAIPTTIGSGAEISSAAVMYSDNKKSKEFVINHQFIPEVIVLEDSPLKMPKKILLSSMVDALSHSVEDTCPILIIFLL